MSRHRKLRLESLEYRRMLAVDFELLKDINPGLGNSYAANLTNVGDVLYFSATDGTSVRRAHRQSRWQHGGGNREATA